MQTGRGTSVLLVLYVAGDSLQNSLRFSDGLKAGIWGQRRKLPHSNRRK